MGGVRFMCRGLDEEANCGNCVESEQIISTQTLTYSYVQIRGTIPLFWEQHYDGIIETITL